MTGFLVSLPRPSLLLLGVLGCSACILPQSVGDDGTTTNSGGGTTTSSASASGSTSSGGMAGDGSSGSSGTSTGPTDSSTDTDDTALSVCDPQPELIGANIVRIDEDPEPLGGDTLVDADCEVLAVVPSELDTQLDVECEGEPLTFDVFLDPPTALPLSVGETLHLRMLEVTTIDSGYFLSLSLADADGLRLGFTSQPYPGQQPDDLDEWFAPLALALNEDVCDPEPFDPPEPGGTSFIMDPCPSQEERLAIDVLGEGQGPVQLLDQTRGPAHGYDVWVSRAVHLTFPENPECGSGRSFFRVLILAEP